MMLPLVRKIVALALEGFLNGALCATTGYRHIYWVEYNHMMLMILKIIVEDNLQLYMPLTDWFG